MSVPIGSLRFEKYLVEKGSKNPVNGALNHALGIIHSSGLDVRDSRELLRLVSQRSSKILELLDDEREQLRRWIFLGNMDCSFKELSKEAGVAKQAIEEYLALCAFVVRSKPENELDSKLYRNKLAFLLYHWEAMRLAQCSLLDALCAFYTASFVCLRVILEMEIKGAFYDCLAKREFRENLTMKIRVRDRWLPLKPIYKRDNRRKHGQEAGRDFHRSPRSDSRTCPTHTPGTECVQRNYPSTGKMENSRRCGESGKTLR